MLMADTMAIFLVVLGFLLAFPGLWLLCQGLWPRAVKRASAICGQGLIKPFLIGAPVTAVMIVIAAILGKLGTAGKISAVGLVCFYLMFANSGVAGLVNRIGERLASVSDVGQTWRATLRGGIALELAFLLPILGWFVILPAAVTIGAGASLIALLKRSFIPSTVSIPGDARPIGAEPSDFAVTGSLRAE
jgi:hypothetical protein